ncbi:MAG: lipoate--protein ligase family protein [Spirochaetaceae bacterium]|nr:MAG: lipoate--protein ligase family protein [Spirochaetaceae bacterium]
MAMAVDQTLLDAFVAGEKKPVFRLYGWSEPTISLGRFQPTEVGLNLAKVKEYQIPLVRRITGGGAIYHDDEITYSMICTQQDLDGLAVKDAYRKLCGFLLRFYRGLGLSACFAGDAAMQDGDAAVSLIGQKTVHCFAGQEKYDVVVNSRNRWKKLGGNAQRRMGQVVFQHGSIPLTLQREDQSRFFAPSIMPEPERVTALFETGENAQLSEQTFSRAELANQIKRHFADEMQLDWVEEPLTTQEFDQAANLAETKYRNDEWNLYGRSES